MNLSKEKSSQRIHLLPQEVIHRIAAGEVVERPAAAVKELVENSIDAGATAISIRIIGGGLQLIEIKDNGMGMSRQDLEASCQRHATSKISTVDDLDSIHSLGFRGEALAALSAVSHLEIASKEKSANEAWLLKREGVSFTTSPTSAPQGTIVRVQELFYNTPARKKFLKSESSESSQCLKIMKELALAHPGVALEVFLLSSKGEIVDELSFPKQSRFERLSSLLKAKDNTFHHQSGKMPELGINAWEFYYQLPPDFARTSKDLYFVVNSRVVDDKRIAYVLREAYGGLIEVGSFPRGAFWVDVDPSVVDVNVHPQKREVRWPHQFPIYSVIYENVKSSLESLTKKSAILPEEDAQIPVFSDLSSTLPFERTPSEKHSPLRTSEVFTPEIISSQVDRSAPAATQAFQRSTYFSSLRVVGEIGAAWLICESPEGMVVIDQHAAHERVRFQEILNEENLFPSQALLVPFDLKLPLSVKGRAKEILSQLEVWGFEGTIKEGGAKEDEIEFIALPKTERKIDWMPLFAEIFDRIDRNESTAALFENIRVHIASSLACHGSVRRGQRLTNDQIRSLLESLDQVDWKQFCPHGRPTMQKFTHEKLEEEFHRS